MMMTILLKNFMILGPVVSEHEV